MPMFNPRPGDTKEGLVQKDVGGPETVEFKDALLFDFDIDGDIPKPAHLEYLREVMRYMRRVQNMGSGRAFVAWIKGFASRRGTETHNYMLSVIREQSIESELVTALQRDSGVLIGMVDFKRDFVGFKESPPGENPAFRAVRLTITRPGPPPPPIRILPAGSKEWSIRLVGLGSLGVPLPKLGPVGVQGDLAGFQITDTSSGPGVGGRVGLFSYTGFGFGIAVPKLGKVGLGPVSGGGLGTPFPFTTTEPMLLNDFSGDANFLQPPAIGPFSVAPSLLTIQSMKFKMKESRTTPPDLNIDGVSVIVNILSTTKGTLKLVMVDGKSLI
jgi:hypothetical protein